MAYTKNVWADSASGGTPITAAKLNNIETGIEAAALVADSNSTIAICRVRRAVAVQSLASATWTTISWDTEVYDTDNMWASANPTYIVVPKAGYYRVRYQLGSSAAGTTARWATRVYRAASATPTTYVPIYIGGLTASAGVQNVTTYAEGIVLLGANDRIRFDAYQDSATAQNTSSTEDFAPTYAEVEFIRT